jgi:hypothetical protein
LLPYSYSWMKRIFYQLQWTRYLSALMMANARPPA